MPEASDQTLQNRLRERAKLAVRGTLQRFDLSIAKGVHANHVARTLSSVGLESVLDIGANIGQYAVALRRAGFTGPIVSCEPLAGAYAQLARRAEGDQSWHAVNVAVGDAPGEIEINVSANSYSSSILPMTEAHLRGAPDSAYVATERVPMTTVAELVEEHGVIPAKTLLKVDTQGYEEQVLAGAGPLVREFGALQLEVSFIELYDGQQLAETLIEQLRDWGFRLQTLEPGFSDPSGRMLQCDVLVVRDS